MEQKGTQFHPSRDRRPAEYDIPGPAFGEAIDITGHGRYAVSELSPSTMFHQDEGDTNHPLLNPMQGRLFNPEKHEAANRQKLGRERFHADSPTAEVIRNRALQESTIPTSHLQERVRSSGTPLLDTQLTTSNNGRPWDTSAGWYQGPALATKPDIIAIDPSSSHGVTNTFVHEAGHRRHLGEGESWSEFTTHPQAVHPDPLKEGVADAYADRYGGVDDSQVREMSKDIEAGRGKFASYQYTGGYSTDPQRSKERGWNSLDRALYAATRGHASETGEQALYEPRGRHVMENRRDPTGIHVGGGDPTIDATLHGLLSTSPHAAQALRQTGLKDVGAAAFRRHRDRQLLTEGQSIQQSMFTDLVGHQSGKIYGHDVDLNTLPYDTPAEADAFEATASTQYDRQMALEQQHGEMVFPHHMSHNQFGETPRTMADVQQTLGVRPVNASKRGFTAL